MIKWYVWLDATFYVTYAPSAKKAINNVRYREALRYVPAWRFEAQPC